MTGRRGVWTCGVAGKLKFWVASLATLMLVAIPTAHADLADGLVGYYSFDDGSGEVLKEQTGNGSDGELINFDFADESDWAPGQIGGALSFDGIDDYVLAPGFPLAETALSVSIWGYALDTPTWGSLVKNWGQGLVGQFHFGLGPGDAETLNIFVTTADGTAYNAGTDLDPIELEAWEHYAFVASPEVETVTLYRNGELVDEQPFDGTFTATPNSDTLGIGVKTADAGDQADPGGCCPGYWNGLLDDLGIWHRALTPEEVADIHARGVMGEPLIGGPSLPGDFDRNGVLDGADMDLLSAEVRAATDPADFDLTGDGAVNQQDRFFWIENLRNSYMGDSNFDGEFNSGDLVSVFTAGQYEDGVAGNSTWATGDWNGDTEFDSSDFVIAFTAGGYEVGPRGAVAAVPEPSALALMLSALPWWLHRRRHASS